MSKFRSATPYGVSAQLEIPVCDHIEIAKPQPLPQEEQASEAEQGADASILPAPVPNNLPTPVPADEVLNAPVFKEVGRTDPYSLQTPSRFPPIRLTSGTLATEGMIFDESR